MELLGRGATFPGPLTFDVCSVFIWLAEQYRAVFASTERRSLLRGVFVDAQTGARGSGIVQP
jgi:hypothetical protein